MRLVTWNVNSLKARLERVLALLEDTAPDVCCLQETKLADSAFPGAAFQELGYEGVHHGNGRWNGVAILSRVGLCDVRAGFLDDVPTSLAECRIVAATCNEVRVLCVYVPNGRVVDSEFYAAKLEFLARLRNELVGTCDPDRPVALCGDFNVAPEDRDVFDVTRFVGATHVSAPERAALAEVMAWGLVDVVRALQPEGPGPFSWWDYRGGAFHKNEGMRIDLALCSAPLARRARAAFVDREARKKGGFESAPSDHAPVIVDFVD